MWNKLQNYVWTLHSNSRWVSIEIHWIDNKMDNKMKIVATISSSMKKSLMEIWIK